MALGLIERISVLVMAWLLCAGAVTLMYGGYVQLTRDSEEQCKDIIGAVYAGKTVGKSHKTVGKSVPRQVRKLQDKR